MFKFLRKKYSIVVIPNSHGRVRSFKMSAIFLPTLLLIFSGLICTIFVMSLRFSKIHISYVNIINKQKSITRLTQIENSILKRRLGNFKHDLRMVRIGLIRLAQRDKKLTLVAHHSSIKNQQQFDLISGKMALVRTETKITKLSNKSLGKQLNKTNSILNSMPGAWPTGGRLTSDFGFRHDPFTKLLAFHDGVDIANKAGTPIVASADGVVTRVGARTGYGISVEIKHTGWIETRYGHLLNKVVVKKGEKVKKGQIIGYMGSTGRSTGNHLHYEILINGIPVNPERFRE